MIPIERGVEPPELAALRAERLPDAQREWAAHGASRVLKSMLGGYGVAKRTLWERQHRKCAYCERPTGCGGQPVEHFRPKKEAWRHRRSAASDVDKDRYWWLTWSWENLLFACQTCNSPAQKGNFFPLVAGTSPLPVGTFDITQESPLLLNPADPRLDIRTHLRWRPVERTAPRPIWRWHLDALTDEGEVTVEIVGLHYLADDLNEHYRRSIWPRFFVEVEQLCQPRHEARELFGAWSSLCRSVIAPQAAWTAASWYMLDALRTSTPALLARRLPAPLWNLRPIAPTG